MKNVYQFNAKLWLYQGKAAWTFVTVPEVTTKEIDYYFALQKRGWGSLPVQVAIGSTIWETSVFPDKKSSTYLLPIKSDIRKSQNLKVGDMVSIQLRIRTEH